MRSPLSDTFGTITFWFLFAGIVCFFFIDWIAILGSFVAIVAVLAVFAGIDAGIIDAKSEIANKQIKHCKSGRRDENLCVKRRVRRSHRILGKR